MSDAIHEVHVPKPEAVQSSALTDAAISAYDSRGLAGNLPKDDKSSASKFLPEGPTIVMDKGVDTTPSLKSDSSTSAPADKHLTGTAEGMKPLRK